MPNCIKCDHFMNWNEAGGICPNCEINRGWTSGRTSEGAAGLFCKGCGKGFTARDCPKCGHLIMGNDLINNVSKGADVLITVIVIIVVLFFVIAIAAG